MSAKTKPKNVGPNKLKRLHLRSHCEHCKALKELEPSFNLATSPQIEQMQLEQNQLPSGSS